jgi:hypothetical protein
MQMLLDPLEEQLDLPAAFAKRADRQRRQCGVVGREPSLLLDPETQDRMQLGGGLE